MKIINSIRHHGYKDPKYWPTPIRWPWWEYEKDAVVMGSACDETKR